MAATLSRRGRRWFARLLSLAVTLVVSLALVAAWARVVQTLLQPPDHKPPIGVVTSVVWGGRVFTTSAQLRAFFEARGLSYTRWAKAHPYAFTGERPPAATRKAAAPRTKPSTRPKPSARPKRAVAKTATTAVPTPHLARGGSGGGSGFRSIVATAVTVLLILAAVALALFATVAARFVPRLSRRIQFDAERRLTVFAAAVTILLGLFIAHFMS